jgi:HlyD family secretion protein
MAKVWRLGLIVPPMIFLGANIGRAVTASDPTIPQGKDVQKAERVLTPASGFDERLTLPQGDFVGGNGVVEPADRETRVAGQTSGRIAAIPVKEGQQVEAGTTLVELESGVQRAALAAAEADVRVADAELTRVLKGNRREDVQAAMAEAEAAAAKSALSSGVAQRLAKAGEGGGATRDEVERAQRQAEADRASANLSDAKRQAVIAGSRLEDVLAARARFAAAEAKREQARMALLERTVVAPIAGEVLQVKGRAGEYYQVGGADALIVLGDTRALRARVDVDERDIGLLLVGQSAIVRAPAFPGEDFRGKVVEVARRMGRKNVRTDDPVERNDAKVLEVVVQLDPTTKLVVGQRITAFLSAHRK